MQEQLKELGLTDNEVRIYILLLEHGLLNPYEISKKLALHRGYVYDALERMLEKEVVSEILKADKKHYQATSPENLVEMQKYRLENLQKVVPDLVKLSGINKEETRVELHKGKRAFRTLMKDITSTLKGNEIVYILGVDEDTVMELEPIYLKHYFLKIEQKNIKEKVIIKRGGKRFKLKNTEYKEIDEKYIGNSFQFFYKNKVSIFIPGSPNYLIIIENKDIADTYIKQFDLLWNIAE